MKPYLLADDLSGALEAGASFRQHGHEASVPLTTVANTATATGLAVMTSETRNESAARAGARVRTILREQKAAGRTLIFKKIDSTLRGPLGAEIDAVIDALNPPLVVLCPTNPAAGRTVLDGVLRVHGTPLAETDFRHDPRSPVQDSRVAARLATQPQTIRHLGLRDLRGANPGAAVTAAQLAGARVLISDAETADDLRRLVTAVRAAGVPAIFVGSNGLAAGLAAQQPPEKILAAAALPRVESLLIVCGSRHAASHRQVESLAPRPDVRVITADPATASPTQLGAALQSAFADVSIVVVRVARDSPAAPAVVLSTLAASIESFAATPRPEAFFFTGGETAWAGCRALGGQRLRIHTPWEDAVVASQLELTAPRNPRWVLTKPGGYGDPHMLVRLLAACMKS